MARALCIRCGAHKKMPWKACPACGLDPSSDSEMMVKSVYLSVGRFDEPEAHDKYEHELDEISAQLQSGAAISFDPAELQRLDEQRQMVESVTRGQVYGALFRFLLPGFAVAGGVWLLYFLLRYFSGR